MPCEWTGAFFGLRVFALCAGSHAVHGAVGHDQLLVSDLRLVERRPPAPGSTSTSARFSKRPPRLERIAYGNGWCLQPLQFRFSFINPISLQEVPLLPVPGSLLSLLSC